MYFGSELPSGHPQRCLGVPIVLSTLGHSTAISKFVVLIQTRKLVYSLVIPWDMPDLHRTHVLELGMASSTRD